MKKAAPKGKWPVQLNGTYYSWFTHYTLSRVPVTTIVVEIEYSTVYDLLRFYGVRELY